MADEPKRNAMGTPEPEREQPVQPYHADREEGSRQDGPGPGPQRENRTEATPAGSVAARRSGPVARQADDEEPGKDERGRPAPMTSGEARGSGSSAGGGGTGASEDIASDSAAGGGRPADFSTARPLPGERGDGPKHGSR